jgi:peptidoglycan/LPS O-acetylase OafA/YrhL
MNFLTSQLRHLTRSYPAAGGYVPALDGIRGFAMMIVLFAHTDVAGFTIIPGIRIGGAGKVGVWLFFVLSAYLLTSQLIGLCEQGLLNGRAWLRYSSRRALRIYPMYTLFVLAAWYFGPKAGTPTVSATDLWRNLTMVQGSAHLWSIPVEFTYYGVLPFIVLAYTAIFRWKFLWITLATGVSVGLMTLYPPTFQVDRFLPYLSIFLLGSYAAVVMHRLADWQPSRSARVACDCIGFILLFVALGLSPYYYAIIVGHPIVQQYWHQAFTLFGVLWALFLVCVLISRRWLARFFSARAMRLYGVISFSSYVIHYVFINAAITWHLPPLLGGWFVMMSVTLASCITFLAIEQPCLRIAPKYAHNFTALAYRRISKGRQRLPTES